MSIPLGRVRTEAETELSRQFAQTPRGVAQARDFAAFERIGLPHRRVESWHYSDLRARLRHALPLAGEPAADLIAAARVHPLVAGEAWRVALVDGRWRPDLSVTPPGVQIRDAAGAEGIADAFGGLEGAAEDSVVLLNGALLQGGVVIDIAADTRIDAPIAIVSLQGAGRSTFQRVVLRLGAGAAATIVERFAKIGEGPAQTNAALAFDVGAGAELTHVAGIAPGAEDFALISNGGRLAAEARYDSTAFVTGEGFCRRQIFLRFEGPRANATLRGVGLLDARLHADTTLVVDHAAPHCVSRERFRHIVDGEATGVFQGKIIVRPGAQKTDGGMKSDTLLLGDGAAMNNKPELEIFADDVVCGHGATVGGLDENQIFYLRARGLPRREAEAMLVEAFAAAGLEEIADEGIRERLREALRAWLARRSAA